MSTSAPVEMLVAAFATETGADDAMAVLKEAKREDLIKIKEAAVVRRDINDKLHINERHDLGAAGGASVGAVIGIVAGMLAGPIGPLVGGAAAAAGGAVGAAVGGATGYAIDRGLSDERLKQLGDALTPGSSAIVAVVEDTWVTELEAELAQAGAEITTAALAADVHDQLIQGRDVAYDTLESNGAVVTGRASGPDA